MPEEKRSHLQALLGDLTKNREPASQTERWSLSDIDALLRDVAADAAPVAIEEPVPEPELEPAPEPALELQEEPPAEEKTVIFQPVSPDRASPSSPEPSLQMTEEPLPPDPSLLNPEELGPAPAQDNMRFDLFQSQELESKLEGVKTMEGAQDPYIEKPGVMLRRVDIQMTTDLSPVPRVVPADELLRQSQPEAQPMDIPEGQQRLPGFEEQAAAQAVSDEELQRKLEKNKAQRTSQFTALRRILLVRA